MEIKTMTQYFPLNFSVESMQPNILLMCKLLFLVLCVYGFVGYIDDPYIPYIHQLDFFLNYPNVFKTLFKSIFVLSGILLLFNIRTRAAAIILGSSVIIILLSSKPLFRNHLFICGCVFLIAGFTNKNSYPWLLFIQFSLVYLGAFVNKVSQIEWWNGQFMYNWLANARENLFFIYTSRLFPEMLLAKLLSWFAMLTELGITVLFFFKKQHRNVGWVILLFHTVLYSITAFRFGHFYEDIVIMLLIFVHWPSEAILVSFNKDMSPQVKRYFRLLSFSKTFEFSTKAILSDDWFQIKKESKIFTNWKALRLFLLYSTNFYVFLFFLDLFIRYLFNGFIMDFIHITLTWVIILFFLPLLLKKKPKIDMI